jgi:UDP-N-acetylglucosamine/UDP-N-acetylgalactosamine 4-epimerase
LRIKKQEYRCSTIQLNSFIMKVLVTGGAGFIGSNLVEHLLKSGAEKVRVLDNLATGFQKNLEGFEKYSAFEFIQGDIRDLAICRKACEGVEYVSHQAALGSVPRSIDDPITTNEVNISGFLNVLVAARDSGIKRMVYAASSSTYGDSTALPKVEDNIGHPLSPYAVTKYVNELYAGVFARNYGFETIGLRYFNVYGPRQNPRGAYAAVIPLFIDAVISGKVPHINGDGEQTRDFTYVENAVQANMKALAIRDKSALNQVYNIALGKKKTLNEMFALINRIAGTDIKATHGPERKGDVRDSLADISKARKLLGYEPSSSIEEGLEKTYRWFRDNNWFNS